MKLFFDTETTGLVNFKLPVTHPSQPRLVQLAALLTEDGGKEVSQLNCMVRPEGFEIPDGASAIHGITTAIAASAGIRAAIAGAVLRDFMSISDLWIGHNVDYDRTVMLGEFKRIRPDFEFDGSFFCTMKISTDICRIPGPYGFKWPKLQEVYRHAFGREFESAHDALADVRACKDVYFWLKNKGFV